MLRLRRAVLKAVPTASEAIRFGCLCYYHRGAAFGAIGGNICMIEVRRSVVVLSFLHGASLADPHRLLRGSGKAKRYTPIMRPGDVSDHRIIALVREAAERGAGE